MFKIFLELKKKSIKWIKCVVYGKNQGFIKIPLIKNCGYIKRFVSKKKVNKNVY